MPARPTRIALLEKASVPFVLRAEREDGGGRRGEGALRRRAMGVAAERRRAGRRARRRFRHAAGGARGDREAGARALRVQPQRTAASWRRASDTSAEAMLKLAGAENAIGGFSGYKPVNAEAVLAAAPDAIVVMTRDGDDAGPGVDVADVLADPTLSQTPAGKAKRRGRHERPLSARLRAARRACGARSRGGALSGPATCRRSPRALDRHRRPAANDRRGAGPLAAARRRPAGDRSRLAGAGARRPRCRARARRAAFGRLRPDRVHAGSGARRHRRSPASAGDDAADARRARHPGNPPAARAFSAC